MHNQPGKGEDLLSLWDRYKDDVGAQNAWARGRDAFLEWVTSARKKARGGYLDLESWIALNMPSDSMTYKGGMLLQMERLRQLGHDIGSQPLVLGTHTSKSIPLPVVDYQGRRGRFLIRDNFYDVNLCVLWDTPVNIPLSAVYPSLSWEEYLVDINRCRNYTFRGWTDEEMEDPRILRVRVTHNKHTYWSEVSAERKDRWLKRMEDPAWYGKDWSSSRIVYEGTFGPEANLYLVSRAFAEGLSSVVRPHELEPYEPGKDAFTVSLRNYEAALEVMRQINDAR